MPKVSVNLGSARPGGIDIALAGLTNQTFQDFEVIFTDGLYHKRHERVFDYVKQSGLKQPFYHVPNHRNRDDIWGVTCAGYNTGFMLSEGEIVIMLLDWAYVAPDWIEQHVKHQAQPKIIMAPHEYRVLHSVVTKDGSELLQFPSTHHENTTIENILAQRAKIDDISAFAEPFRAEQLDSFAVSPDSDAKCRMGTGPSGYEYFNTKNESFPLEAVMAVNGMDETYDLGRGPGDPDLAYRLAKMPLPIWIVNEAKASCLNPRQILPNMNIIIPDEGRLGPPYESRWFIQDGYRYFNEVRGRANPAAPNPYSLRERSRDLWGWRELSQHRETLIPRVVIPDAEYYK